MSGQDAAKRGRKRELDGGGSGATGSNNKKRERAAAERGRSKRNRQAFERLRLALDGESGGAPRARCQLLLEAVDTIAHLRAQVITLGSTVKKIATNTEQTGASGSSRASLAPAAGVGVSARPRASPAALRRRRGAGGGVASTEIASLLHNLGAARQGAAVAQDAATLPAMAFAEVVAPHAGAHTGGFAGVRRGASSPLLPLFSALPAGHELQRARTIIEEQEGSWITTTSYSY